MSCEPYEPMNFRFGLDILNPKKKNRWLLKIDYVSASDPGGTAYSLPPKRGTSPGISWKEESFQHLTETIWVPVKPEWKPINLTLFDAKCNGDNPVFQWIKRTKSRKNFGLYDPKAGIFTTVVDSEIKRQAELVKLDGCGSVMERWIIDNCYPSSVEFGELDMDSAEIVVIDITLRYDRAYLAIDDDLSVPDLIQEVQQEEIHELRTVIPPPPPNPGFLFIPEPSNRGFLFTPEKKP